MATENSVVSHVSTDAPPLPEVNPPEESPMVESLSLETSVQETISLDDSEAVQDESEVAPIPATDPQPHTCPENPARPPSFHRYSQEPRPPPGHPTEPLAPSLLSPISSNDDSSVDSPDIVSSPHPRLPPLSLGALSNFHPQRANGPAFSSADEPPPYSPTHTILPHYFSLEPIPVRSYIIKDSTSLPFMFDFWLCSTTNSNPFHEQATASLSASMSPIPTAAATTNTTPESRPHSPTLQLQERGLASQQHQNELKYCIIRPTHTDRTAIPLNGSTGPNAYFIPALALVAANYPSRWIWWGTEALQLVVFGRNLKNIVMEWRWKHGRTRIGGPIVHRLVGCSFRVTPDRRYCWKQGTGKRRSTTHSTENGRRTGRSSGIGTQSRREVSGSSGLVSNGGGSWFGTFFSRGRVPTDFTTADTTDIPLGNVHPLPTLNEQDTIADRQEHTLDEDEDGDEELGCYHCREESPSGVTGRIVAIYKPGRPANRARDRPATSRKLEIYTELGERCETAMMLMCTRLEDLFVSVPEQKKGPFIVRSRQEAPSTENGTEAGADNGEVAEIGNEQERGEGLELDATELSIQRSRSLQSMSLKQRIVGTKAAWKMRVKWIVAAVLIAVVAVLVFKPKSSH
ncbi:hypothetical protein EMPS_07443 [Entomortierella parvispora]|uniref:Uncharacterized protein n=1 Tax=Entomortierella parvispora TaxID=205924 RepID=A0A9P3LYP8_9FUNG|nr:hypothetical protein EMPS_07443 [Entomortierella parvispora]